MSESTPDTQQSDLTVESQPAIRIPTWMLDNDSTEDIDEQHKRAQRSGDIFADETQQPERLSGSPEGCRQIPHR